MAMDLKARDIMNEVVVACVADTRVEDVVKKLAEHDISGMPVLDVQKHVIGIVSESDLLLADELEPPRTKTALYGLYVMPERVIEEAAKSRGVLARDVMTTRVISFHPEDSVHDIAKRMQAERINRVPIVDEAGVLVGILTRGDILKALAERL